ncbi:hypothetical protein ACP4OV_028581 [Aristida adscensionis]
MLGDPGLVVRCAAARILPVPASGLLVAPVHGHGPLAVRVGDGLGLVDRCPVAGLPTSCTGGVGVRVGGLVTLRTGRTLVLIAPCALGLVGPHAGCAVVALKPGTFSSLFAGLSATRGPLSVKEVALRESLAARIPTLLDRVSGFCGAPSNLQENPSMVVGRAGLVADGSSAHQPRAPRRSLRLACKANGRSNTLVEGYMAPDATAQMSAVKLE